MLKHIGFLVGVRGFEPPASWSRTKHSTKLSHTPSCYLEIISHENVFVKLFL